MFRFIRRVFIILILLIIVFFIFRLIKPEATSRFIDKVKVIPSTISGRFHREKKSKIIINGDTTSTSSNFEIINKDDNNEYYDIDYTPTVIDENNNEEYEVINENNYETTNNGEIQDTSRLDELNRELDRIMTSGNNQTEGKNVNNENTGSLGEIISELVDDNNIKITEMTPDTQNTGFVVIDVEQPYEPEPQNSTNNQNNSQNTTTNSQNTTTNGQNTTNNSQNTTTNSQNTTTNSSSNNQNNSTPKKTSTTPAKQQWGDCGSGLTVQDCEEFYNVFGNINIEIN